jgi:26S proteasome regulatory subunit N2
MRDFEEKVAIKRNRAEENGEAFDESLEHPDIDGRLTSIVEGMFDRCLAEGEHKQALGMAIESMRLDVIERVVSVSDEKEMLQYCYEVGQNGFRQK